MALDNQPQVAHGLREEKPLLTKYKRAHNPQNPLQTHGKHLAPRKNGKQMNWVQLLQRPSPFVKEYSLCSSFFPRYKAGKGLAFSALTKSIHANVPLLCENQLALRLICIYSTNKHSHRSSGRFCSRLATQQNIPNWTCITGCIFPPQYKLHVTCFSSQR